MKAHPQQLTCKNNNIQEGRYDDFFHSQYFKVEVIRNFGMKSWKNCRFTSLGKKKIKKKKETQNQLLPFHIFSEHCDIQAMLYSLAFISFQRIFKGCNFYVCVCVCFHMCLFFCVFICEMEIVISSRSLSEIKFRGKIYITPKTKIKTPNFY